MIDDCIALFARGENSGPKRRFVGLRHRRQARRLERLEKAIEPRIRQAGEKHPPKRDVPMFNAGILKGLELGEGTFYFLLSSLFWLLSLNFIVSMPLHMQTYVKELPLTMPFWITGVERQP